MTHLLPKEVFQRLTPSWKDRVTSIVDIWSPHQHNRFSPLHKKCHRIVMTTASYNKFLVNEPKYPLWNKKKAELEPKSLPQLLAQSNQSAEKVMWQEKQMLDPRLKILPSVIEKRNFLAEREGFSSFFDSMLYRSTCETEASFTEIFEGITSNVIPHLVPSEISWTDFVSSLYLFLQKETVEIMINEKRDCHLQEELIPTSDFLIKLSSVLQSVYGDEIQVEDRTAHSEFRDEKLWGLWQVRIGTEDPFHVYHQRSSNEGYAATNILDANNYILSSDASREHIHSSQGGNIYHEMGHIMYTHYVSNAISGGDVVKDLKLFAYYSLLDVFETPSLLLELLYSWRDTQAFPDTAAFSHRTTQQILENILVELCQENQNFYSIFMKHFLNTLLEWVIYHNEQSLSPVADVTEKTSFYLKRVFPMISDIPAHVNPLAVMPLSHNSNYVGAHSSYLLAVLRAVYILAFDKVNVKRELLQCPFMDYDSLGVQTKSLSAMLGEKSEAN